MQAEPRSYTADRYLVHIDAPGALLDGELALPPNPRGIVVFVHGTGYVRQSTRDKILALSLGEDASAGTLLVDLQSEPNEPHELRGAEPVLDLDLITQRVLAIREWLEGGERTRGLPVALFGAGSGAAVALMAAVERPDSISTVVTRSGRPDLAGAGALARIRVPTLFIVPGDDPLLLDINRQALLVMHNHPALEVVPGAGDLFEEPGTLGEMSRRVARWLRSHLGASASAASPSP
jgi:putative phosphoribosyl transferase